MMKAEIKKNIEQFNMIKPGDRVIVGLSGGSDSMTLLTVLDELKEEMKFTLEAAHVNHSLRGNDALRDQKFVEDICASKGIHLHLLVADVASEADKTGEGLEEAGRRIRYGFFASLGSDAVIATAHNSSDRIETMLFNLARGSSLNGLCSIPPVRGNIIRPLITISKSEIEKYCKENDIPYVVDGTNTDVAYSRNRIRHNVVTELEQINPSFQKCAARCIDNINEDEAYLNHLAGELFDKAKSENAYSIDIINASPIPLKKRVVARILSEEFGINANSVMIENVISACMDYFTSGKGRNIELCSGFCLRTRAGVLEVPEKKFDIPDETEVSEGVYEFGNRRIIISVVNKTETNNLQKPNVISFCDYDKICGSIKLRSMAPGDKFRPCGRGVTKQLRKMFNEQKIPPEERVSKFVVSDDNGPIMVEGFGADERVKADHSSKKILIIGNVE